MLKSFEHALEKFIFASRWIQAPLYVGLILGAVLYTFRFMTELIHLSLNVAVITEATLMLGILSLVDITMVANLLIMVIIGGYTTFVSAIDLDHHEDRPEWLQKIDAGSLKVKLAGSLVGISGIHLLTSFINIENKTIEHVQWQIVIHVVFLFSTLVLAFTEKVLHQVHHK